MSVFISAGHSNKDPGAVANGVKEAEVAVDFRNMVASYLTKAGVPISTDGTGTENWPLNKAAAEARKHKIAVEFHLNAAGPTARGVETLSSSKDYALGNKICEAVSRVLDTKNRGAKSEDSGQHKKLAFVQAGGIIVELFFVTSKADLQAYVAKKWLAAKAVAKILEEAHNATV